MFLKSLKIENSLGLIREIEFHKGLNLIVDETVEKNKKATGNNVGKTTVLQCSTSPVESLAWSQAF